MTLKHVTNRLLGNHVRPVGLQSEGDHPSDKCEKSLSTTKRNRIIIFTAALTPHDLYLMHGKSVFYSSFVFNVPP